MNILEIAKGLTQEQVVELQKARPELFQQPSVTVKMDAQIKEAIEKEVSGLKSQFEGQMKSANEKISALEAEKVSLNNKLEAHALKEKAKEQQAAREAMVDKLLESSRLKPEHKTPTFRATLLSVRDTQVEGKTLTEQEQMSQLIKDREAICLAENADPNAREATNKDMSAAEKHIAFAKNMFGTDVSEVYKHPEIVGKENVIKVA